MKAITAARARNLRTYPSIAFYQLLGDVTFLPDVESILPHQQGGSFAGARFLEEDRSAADPMISHQASFSQKLGMKSCKWLLVCFYHFSFASYATHVKSMKSKERLLPSAWMDLVKAIYFINLHSFRPTCRAAIRKPMTSVPTVIENDRVAEINQCNNPFRILILLALPACSIQPYLLTTQRGDQRSQPGSQCIQ